MITTCNVSPLHYVLGPFWNGRDTVFSETLEEFVTKHPAACAALALGAIWAVFCGWWPCFIFLSSLDLMSSFNDTSIDSL
jgi:uncharacterized membrane protein YccF (DUF307 family)